MSLGLGNSLPDSEINSKDLGWVEHHNPDQNFDRLCREYQNLLQVAVANDNFSVTNVLTPLYSLRNKLDELGVLGKKQEAQRKKILFNIEVVARKTRENPREGAELLPSFIPLLETNEITNDK